MNELKKERTPEATGVLDEKKQLYRVDPDELIGEISDAFTNGFGKVLENYKNPDWGMRSVFPLGQKTFSLTLNHSKKSRLVITVNFEKINCD